MTDPNRPPRDLLSEPELREWLTRYRRENWRGIQTEQVQTQIVEQTVRADFSDLLHLIRQSLPLGEKSRVLDLGSGVGSFVVACRRRGLAAFGVEPDRIGQGAKVTSLEIARRRLADRVFVSGVGEALPFASGCFDVVVMNQVIEHVRDQPAVVREATRVLRPGGLMYVACPNYLRFYEPHYKIVWIPLLPKFLGRLYLRLRGRSPAMLDQLTYTTNRRLRKLLASLGDQFTVVDLHRESFLTKRATDAFAAPSARTLSRLTRLPVLGRTILWFFLIYVSASEGGCEMIVRRKPRVSTP